MSAKNNLSSVPEETIRGVVQASTLGDSRFQEKTRQRGLLLYKGWQDINDFENKNTINRAKITFAHELNAPAWPINNDRAFSRTNKLKNFWNSLVNPQGESIDTVLNSEHSEFVFKLLTSEARSDTASYGVSFVDNIEKLEKIYSLLNVALNINPTSATEKIGEGVLDFCEKEGIKRYFYQYLSFIKVHLGNVKSINAYLYSDPEVDDTIKVVFEIFIKDEVGNILKMQDKFYAVVIDWLPIKSLAHFVLKCEHYGSN